MRVRGIATIIPTMMSIIMEKIKSFCRKFARSCYKRHVNAKRIVRMTKELEHLEKEKKLLELELQIKDNYLKRAEDMTKQDKPEKLEY